MAVTGRTRRRPLAGGLAIAAVAALTASGAVTAPAAAATPASAAAPVTGVPTTASGPLASGQPATAGTLGSTQACPAAAPGAATCLALLDSRVHWYGTSWGVGAAPAVQPRTSPPASGALSASGALPAYGYQPFMAAQLQSAYKLPSRLLGARQTIAIVDAYNDPKAAHDLAVYRAASHLPACAAGFDCFEQVNQEGKQGDYPPGNPNWGVEESLDIEMASAICPNCRIILVEANNDLVTSLFAAEDEAVKLGANVISNSWGAVEFPGEAAAGAAFDHHGVAIVAATGDNGFGVYVPAAYSTVIAAGGTALYPQPGARGWTESVWSGTGVSAASSGCSAYIPKPSWQHDPLCGMRTVGDVSAVADPATPVAVYDTFGGGGWYAVGGTSVASPIIASVYALAGNAATITADPWLYAHHRSLFDVTSGFEGAPGANGDCGGSYLCTAGPGYDGPTGLGTPNGIGAF